jgi:anti-sigma factor RsiW
MNCKKAKELILTDYIDNEMGAAQKERLGAHLDDCPGCKVFFETVEHTVVRPFAGAKRVEPPEFIWQEIKGAIMSEQREKPCSFLCVLGRLESFLHGFRPALALSTIAALALIAAIAVTLKLNRNEVAMSGRERLYEYSEYSIEYSGGAIAESNDGFGTTVEEFFL